VSGFVIDASVAFAWCFDDEASAATRAMLDRFETYKLNNGAKRGELDLHRPSFCPARDRADNSKARPVVIGRRGQDDTGSPARLLAASLRREL
jgi:hypothetical protein